MTTSPPSQEAVRSLVPARIDRLPWSRFHTFMVVALGSCWVLDGFEITVASNVADKFTTPEYLGLSQGAAAGLGSAYLAGQVVGALVFGQISDRLGRRRLFLVTLAVYMIGSALTAFTLGTGIGSIVFLYATRVIAGIGIGGEYAAINSAIDELIPSAYRGRVDILVNGTYWGGATLAALVQIPLFADPSTAIVSVDYGWRIAFLIGPVLALGIVFLRRGLPESPRWQIMHGHGDEAETTIAEIEHQVERSGKTPPPVDPSKEILIRPADDTGFVALTRTLFTTYPRRSIVGATLMITQSFLFNAIFFTYSLVLGNVFHVQNTSLYYIPFALGNLIGPIVLGPLFDTIGRRKMIGGTYLISGVLLIISASLFRAGVLNAVTQTVAWSIIFFFASAGASAAYLTVSETFPQEVRAKAIAVFFSIAQFFGFFAPIIYGLLIDKNSANPDRSALFYGYLGGAIIMIVGAVVAYTLGEDAERKSLEDVATPLAVVRATGAGPP